jgi:hypothetical protein
LPSVDNLSFKKDYVKQIKEHIKTIIQTGKGSKVGTLSAFIEKERKLAGKEANVGIKLL